MVRVEHIGRGGLVRLVAIVVWCCALSFPDGGNNGTDERGKRPPHSRRG